MHHLIFSIFLLLLLLPVFPLSIKTGDMIQLKTLGRFVRVDPASSQNSRLMIDTSTAWAHGSTFKVTVTNDNKWQLRSLTGKYVTAENGGGAGLYANRDSASGWETFSVQWVGDNLLNLKSFQGGWVGANADVQYASLISSAAKPDTWELFEVVLFRPIRGVNLGSWFVPENWMVDVYNGSGGDCFCDFVRKVGRNEAETRIIQHLNSWIVESDFAWLASQRVNNIRLPIGYWNVINDPYNMYVPVDPSTSFKYIDQAFDWAEKYGITVLLDLHGGPGSQQGQDHSGCSGSIGWNTPQNHELSVKAISSMIQRYGSRPNLYGIELLNEPGWDLEQNNHSDLVSYYQSAYWEIRKYSESAKVVINCLFGDVIKNSWNSEMSEAQGYHNVLIDMHFYDCFGDQAHASTGTHIDDAYKWSHDIEYNNQFKPVFVGEWSLATGDNPGGQPFADGQKYSYSFGIGSYFWNYKLAKDKNNDVWSFRTAIETGWII